MAENIYDIIRRPITTEKSSLLQEQGQYVFEVARSANKIQIREAIEKTIPGNPKVVNVRIINMHRKARNRGRWAGYTPAWKKAIVTLAPGQHIDLFEGV